MKLTIDNSVAIKWVIAEVGSARARTYLPDIEKPGTVDRYFLSAPALIELEFHNTLSKNLKGGIISRRQFTLAKLLAFTQVQIDAVDTELVREASDYSVGGRVWLAAFEGRPAPVNALPFNIYDCLYIAHARRGGHKLLTADSEQARIARAMNIPVEFILAE